MSEIDDRRSKAREAGLDATCGMWDGEDFNNGVERAVEVATQVKITDEVIEEFREHALIPRAVVESALRHTLAALGFEVIE